MSGLDEAWAAAEAALPKGAHIGGLTSFLVDTRTGKPAEWVASAFRETRAWNSQIEGRGKTPAAALQDLARRLQDAA